ncbi:single-stranded DNA-binding protein [Lactobacillus amylovorus]|uniref:single-stranded DNA-binding protein n=1 Tax=Lactobacillus amylovorus TaxID=1604 RepID=UPI003F9E96CE
MSTNTITICGNLTDSPEVRFTQAGAAVATMTVAHNHRRYVKQTGEWIDGDTTFLRCTVWRDMAEHAADTLRRGMRVIVTGELQSRTYEDKEGQRRTTFELSVDDIGPSLRTQTAIVNRSQRGQATQVPQPQDDPWASQTGEAPF